MNKMTLRTVPALLLVAFSGAASAAAFQLLEQNASGLGTAYAGSAAVADNASTVFFNPAGMTQLTGIQLSAGVTGVGPSYQYRSTAGVESGGDAGGWAAVPNAYMSWQMSKDLFVGFGISAPFGLATEYDSGWAGAAQAIKSEIKTINFNPSLAYRVNDKVSLGFGVNYQTVDGELTRTGVVLKGDDASWGWNAGALFTLSPAMRVGLSYRSAIKHRLEGTVNGAVPIRADVELPDTFTLSVWQQVSDRWEAMGDLSYTRWSTLQRFDVRHRTLGILLSSETFNYDDSWRIAWGAAYKVNDAAKLKFGIAYDRTPVRDEFRSARVPDNDRLWLSLGGQWNAGNYGKVDVGYSYLYVKDPGISLPAGKYDASAHLVGVQYSAGF
jgi:long-chain fatty acid transport protein